jgi:hypothetical protein
LELPAGGGAEAVETVGAEDSGAFMVLPKMEM